MKKIRIIIPYFGKWPVWIDLFLKTCEYNPSIDWLFFTDCTMPNSRIDNVTYVKWNVNDFNALATKKLGFNVETQGTFKHCDYKPAYGVIFDSYLKGYDFWGFGDIDVIYGNIRQFITDNVLETYEIIGARDKFLTGHFCLYKNNPKVNHLFEEITGLKELFRRDVYQCVEEKYMTILVKRLMQERRVKALFKNIMEYDCWPSRGKKWKIYWNKGKLLDVITNNELAYFHFGRTKYLKSFIFPKLQDGVEDFYLFGDIIRQLKGQDRNITERT